MKTLEKLKGLQEQQCIVDVLLEEVTANECNNCGKCVFGYEGVTQLRIILHDIAEKKAQRGDLELIQELGQLMGTQSLCEVGVELAEVIRYAVSEYGAELTEHIAKRSCRAGVCKKFTTVHILADKCTGCGRCREACEEQAILGKRRFVHVINQDECTQCGVCREACDEDAIVRAGVRKPRCPKKPIPCKR